MFSTLLRLLSWLILAGGVIVGIVDATRSVAANSLQLTHLGGMLEVYVPSVAVWIEGHRAGLEASKISNWSPANVIDYVNSIPVTLLAAGLFLLIYTFASRNRETRHF